METWFVVFLCGLGSSNGPVLVRNVWWVEGLKPVLRTCNTRPMSWCGLLHIINKIHMTKQK